jgi:hypothetical protein
VSTKCSTVASLYVLDAGYKGDLPLTWDLSKSKVHDLSG